MEAPAANPKNEVRSVAKAFAVLRAFTPDTPSLTLAEIAARAGLDRGTAFRLAHTLANLGYLHAESRRFRLTLQCLELGHAALSQGGLSEQAAPLLRALVPGAADAASLGALERGEVVYLARADGGLDRHGVIRRPGSRIGAYATALGQAILAFLPRDEQVAQLDATPRVKLSDRTLTAMDALLARLDSIRAEGVAVSEGENAYGLLTVAAPVLDGTGAPLAAVSLTASAGRDPAGFTQAAIPAARELAATLATAIRHGAAR